MISEIVSDAEGRMKKSIESLTEHFKKIRTGRASPAILDSVQVSYYGSMVPIQQVANVSVEDARTLMINPWEKKMVPEVEKAIMKSDLGLNPATNGDIIRVPMPALSVAEQSALRRAVSQHGRDWLAIVASVGGGGLLNGVLFSQSSISFAYTHL